MALAIKNPGVFRGVRVGCYSPGEIHIYNKTCGLGPFRVGVCSNTELRGPATQRSAVRGLAPPPWVPGGRKWAETPANLARVRARPAQLCAPPSGASAGKPVPHDRAPDLQPARPPRLPRAGCGPPGEWPSPIDRLDPAPELEVGRRGCNLLDWGVEFGEEGCN